MREGAFSTLKDSLARLLRRVLSVMRNRDDGRTRGTASRFDSVDEASDFLANKLAAGHLRRALEKFDGRPLTEEVLALERKLRAALADRKHEFERVERRELLQVLDEAKECDNVGLYGIALGCAEEQLTTLLDGEGRRKSVKRAVLADLAADRRDKLVQIAVWKELVQDERREAAQKKEERGPSSTDAAPGGQVS